MQRSRTPSFTNPFLVWSRLAWKTSEVMLASAQVIQHRTRRIAAAGAAARLAPRGLKPIHSRATANANRLGKR